MVDRFGGPEVLRVVDDAPDPVVVPGTFLLEIDHAGVNYADTHQVEDSYLAPTRLPFIPGVEAVGRAPDGRRMVTLLPSGGYATHVAAPVATSFALPDDIDDASALALILQGTTAWHLLRTAARLEPGETVVVMAGAGGVGSLAIQLARALGAGRIVAAASTPDKRRLASTLGADATVDSTPIDLTERLREACGGRADVVLEMTGGPTTAACLAALGPFGRLVVYGMASRTPTDPIDVGRLMTRSRAVIGFWLADTLRDPGRLLGDPLADLIVRVQRGALRCVPGGDYPLAHATQAHEDLRARRTVGKLMLDPRR